MENNTEPLAYSVQEAAEMLGVSRDLINDAIRLKTLRSVKLGRRRLIPVEAIEAFLSQAA
jgi:excisionase family DNA binding protein